MLCGCHIPFVLLPLLPQVLHEYQTRDDLLQQLLSERDEVRRASKRSGAETNRLERERDEAQRAAARLKVGWGVCVAWRVSPLQSDRGEGRRACCGGHTL
jgi:hypothetical protein